MGRGLGAAGVRQTLTAMPVIWWPDRSWMVSMPSAVTLPMGVRIAGRAVEGNGRTGRAVGVGASTPEKSINEGVRSYPPPPSEVRTRGIGGAGREVSQELTMVHELAHACAWHHGDGLGVPGDADGVLKCR